jgi:hypothetical protein
MIFFRFLPKCIAVFLGLSFQYILRVPVLECCKFGGNSEKSEKKGGTMKKPLPDGSSYACGIKIAAGLSADKLDLLFLSRLVVNSSKSIEVGL